MVDPYPCPKCGEMLIKSESRISQYGNMIPINYYNGKLSSRGENHICPTKVKSGKSFDQPVADGFIWNKASLGLDGYWYAVDEKGRWTKRLEKARLEELQSWDPGQPDEIDHSRDGTIHG